MKETSFVGNGFIDFGKLANAHLYYREKSITVDYEKVLNDYTEDIIKDTTKVPCEIFPYNHGLKTIFVSINSEWHQVDVEELIKKVNELIENEDYYEEF